MEFEIAKDFMNYFLIGFGVFCFFLLCSSVGFVYVAENEIKNSEFLKFISEMKWSKEEAIHRGNQSANLYAGLLMLTAVSYFLYN